MKTTFCYVAGLCAIVTLVQLVAVGASPTIHDHDYDHNYGHGHENGHGNGYGNGYGHGPGYGSGGQQQQQQQQQQQSHQQQQQQQQNNQHIDSINNLTNIRVNNYTNNLGHLIRHKRGVLDRGYRVCIKSKAYGEYLYAAQDKYALDEDRRRVYTWVPKDKSGLMVFKFHHMGGNDYYIRSEYFGELLIATDMHKLGGYINRRPGVFTYRGYDQVGPEGRWTVTQEGDAYLIYNTYTKTYLYADLNQKTEDTRRHIATVEFKTADSYWYLENC